MLNEPLNLEITVAEENKFCICFCWIFKTLETRDIILEGTCIHDVVGHKLFHIEALMKSYIILTLGTLRPIKLVWESD